MTNREAIEILRQSNNIGYGVIIEGDSTREIEEALRKAITALEEAADNDD